MKILKIIFFTLFQLIIFSSDSFSQETNLERIEINNRIKYANNLIWHFNKNIRSLNIYQENLKLWFEDENRNMHDLPKFEFLSYTEKKVPLDLSYKKQDIFDYNFHLDELLKQILLFNINCRKLKNLKSENSEQFRKEVFNLIKTIQIQSLNISEIAYDFSRSCAINYKSQKLPIQLKRVKNVVSQSKNLILAFRNSNKRQTKDYLKMLDEALAEQYTKLSILSVFYDSKTNLELSELKILITNIYEKAFKIASWGEQYLQADFSSEGLNNLIKESILEFNEVAGKMGCASSFNVIIENSEDKYMYFIEEPNTIFAELIEETPIKQNTRTGLRKKIEVQEVGIKNQTILQETKTPEIIEKFDKSNINTLAGALTNNLIILMDVSSSMKTSGKLPILKESITHILNIMRKDDKISLIAYSGEAKVLISGASKLDKPKILNILEDLQSGGGADLQNALALAYQLGLNNYITNGNNKLIIASDGIFGVTYSILNLVKSKTLKGFSLSIFQYNEGVKSKNSTALKSLAEIGNGTLRIISSSDNAISILMEEIKKEAH